MPKCMSTSEFCVLVELALLFVQYTNLEILFRMNFFFSVIRNLLGSYTCFSKKVLRSMVKIAHHHRYTTEIKYITCCPNKRIPI